MVCNPQPLDGKHSLQQLLQKRLLQQNVSLSRWLLMLLGRPEPELSGQFFIYHQRKKNLGRELHVTQCAFLSQAKNQAVPTGHTDRTLALAGLLNSCSHSRDRVENRPVADRIPTQRLLGLTIKRLKLTSMRPPEPVATSNPFYSS